jgi:hypothetical protein
VEHSIPVNIDVAMSAPDAAVAGGATTSEGDSCILPPSLSPSERYTTALRQSHESPIAGARATRISTASAAGNRRDPVVVVDLVVVERDPAGHRRTVLYVVITSCQVMAGARDVSSPAGPTC